MNQLDHSLDNVDQRVTADVDIALQYMTEAWFGGIFKAETGFMFNFFGILCAVYLGLVGQWWNEPPNDRRAGVNAALVPLSFIIVALPINAALANRVARVQMRQQEFEGEFREAHARVCLNSENIRFYGGESTELALLEKESEPVFENFKEYGTAKIPLDLFSLIMFYAKYAIAESGRRPSGAAS